MKTEEDEAFDDLAKRQGAWGSGFPAKRAMAADKLQEPWNEDEWRKNNWRCQHGWLRGEQCEICNAAQEPPSEWAGIKAVLDEYGLQAIDFVANFKAALAQPAQEPVAWITPDGEGFRIRFSAPTNDVPLGWDALYTIPPKREWVGLTDEDIPALLPEADGCAEADVKRVEVQPGFWGEECSLIDAWSFPLVMQILSAHEAALKEKNNGT